MPGQEPAPLRSLGRSVNDLMSNVVREERDQCEEAREKAVNCPGKKGNMGSRITGELIRTILKKRKKKDGTRVIQVRGVQ